MTAKNGPIDNVVVNQYYRAISSQRRGDALRIVMEASWSTKKRLEYGADALNLTNAKEPNYFARDNF